MVYPDTVHNYASRERVAWMNDRFGQFPAAAAMLEWLAIGADNLQKLPWHIITQSTWLASAKDSRLIRSGRVVQDHGPRWCARARYAPFFHRLQQLLVFAL